MLLRLCLWLLCAGGCLSAMGQTYERTTLLTKMPALKKEVTGGFTVFVFLSPECPLCKNYSVVLKQLSEQYAGQVRFAGIVPGKAYSMKDIRRFRKHYAIPFAIYRDRDRVVSTYLEATVTPEVLLINNTGIALYRGAIDNWVVNLGKKRPAATEHYLAAAIQQSLQQQPVVLSRTTPVGCLINDF
ncbi:MAG: redoxin domain-containing protein [Chitinophaga sp.]|uniref:redoxin domain-containing protein n=1 Tax=Chitinophaga sp. TaxID=1869181 RepID=UPI001B215775|nr:redoxin domain-containing protein [Chitinophaga sp.]MBO9730663.1 redoxin domain-containing protein [Chitinophaga sp.]